MKMIANGCFVPTERTLRKRTKKRQAKRHLWRNRKMTGMKRDKAGSKNGESSSAYEAERRAEENAFDRIYEIVRRIPRGKVATYGQIARLAGNPRWSRVVGYALHVNPDPEGIPCYRVVNRFGSVSSAFAFGGQNEQIALLAADGIPSTDGIVDLKLYQWDGRS